MIYLIAGIGTDVGKTLVSAILTKMLNASYYKPINCGLDLDSDRILELTGLSSEKIIETKLSFKNPVSPHQAADLEKRELYTKNIQFPTEKINLIIESVGGVLVPINSSETTLDLFAHWPCKWIVVSKHYLGSINHTLMTLKILEQKGIPVEGIIFNGNKNTYTEEAILKHTSTCFLGRINEEKLINLKVIERYVKQWKNNQYWKDQLKK